MKKNIKNILCTIAPVMLAIAIIFSTGSGNDVYALTIDGTLGEIGEGNEDGEDFGLSITETTTETTTVENKTETTTACTHATTKISNAKKATTSANGYTGDTVCSKCGKTIKKGSSIAKIKSATLKTTSYTYNGKAKKPSVTVKDSNGKTIASSNYTVTYSDNKNVGTATAKIKFTGSKYSGGVSKTFKINPKGTSISGKITAKSKGFKVTWKAQKTQTTGYQIQYSTSKSFKSATIKTVKKNTTKTYTVTKLKAKKKYYVRVRTYTTVKGKKYYSSWSSAKTVTTKK